MRAQYLYCLSRNKANAKEKGGEMELPGLRRCYDQSQSSFQREQYKGYLPSKTFDEMGPSMMEQAIPKEFIDSYCKTLKELEEYRKEIKYLRTEKRNLESELIRNRKDLEEQRNVIDSERQLRKRIQDKLRHLADDLENGTGVVSDCATTTRKSSTSDEVDIEYYKDQFRVYQEDFKLEKEENIKLRTLNTQLTNELEEAKQVMESQEKKLLVYAQVFSNGTGSQVILPPAYIGRRVHSNPTTPSYSQGSASSAPRTYQIARDTRDVSHFKKPSYDPITDIVPKGIAEDQELKFDFTRKKSFSDGEMESCSSTVYKRRTKSIL
ncbi:uncharacterized protein LOC135681807 isoform X2 [Rhopilema esculentum]|uniref:uncharacterized protein LOC135681807 isoform X2 n=1 Tax=Rhopilema esculentum TaxID=499914 RepID=UPI0031E382C7